MMTGISLEKGFPLVRVAVLESTERAPKGYLPCVIGLNLGFSTKRLESYCLASWKAIVFDALIVAAAVEFCDRMKKRPALGWGRRFDLRVPVHDVSLWSNKLVHGSLVDALEFLTGDCWQIEFRKRRTIQESDRQQYLPVPTDITTIIPFSDGIDSRAVSAILEKELGSRLCRVRLGTKAIARKNSGGQRQPFTAVPYKVSVGKQSGETSARSRGFKFATVSAVAAHLVGAKKIIVPESGQGALGPVLVPTGHGYEDYRNHPFFTDRMEPYIKALFGEDIRFAFPRLWHTKGETLAEFAAITNDRAHIDAHSCWQGSRQVSVDKHRRQCGICAACMLRRLSVHAAGLREPEDTYIWENLDASEFEAGATRRFKKFTPALREYAIAGTLHLDHLAELRRSPLHRQAIRRNAYKLARSQDLSPEKAEANLDRLLRQHEMEWRGFVHSLGPRSFVRKWVASVS
jgi:7-cyano-7-deazaguanine synthase in queuosine biosynthesis